MNLIKEYLQELTLLTMEMSPFLLLGFLIAGVLHVLISKSTISKFLGKRDFKSVLYASLLGIPLPLCSCGVIPTGIAFNKEGASRGATVSFLISTPQTGIDSILITYSMLGLPFAILRPIISLISGIVGGTLTNFFDEKVMRKQMQYSNETPSAQQESLEEEKHLDSHENHSGHEHKRKKQYSKPVEILYYGFVEFMEDIAKWLLIGLLLAALISVAIPNDFFSSFIHTPILGILLTLLASIPLYVCATGSVPVAAVLLMKGISPGAALVFLMAGPATNIATITVLGNSLGKRATISYLVSIITSAIIFGLFIDYFLPTEWFALPTNGNHIHNKILPEWLKISSTITLMSLMLNALLKKNSLLWYKETIENSTLTLKIDGMRCNHCSKRRKKC